MRFKETASGASRDGKHLMIVGFSAALRAAASVCWPYVDSIDQQVMFAEKSWGSYRVLDVSDRSMTVKVTLNPGHGMNYHSHEKRDEVWMVVSGSGRVIIDGVN